MFTYFKMKKAELKVKAAFYGIIAKAIDEKSDVVTMVKSLYESCKGMSGDDIRDMVLYKIAELVHTQATEERNAEENK